MKKDEYKENLISYCKNKNSSFCKNTKSPDATSFDCSDATQSTASKHLSLQSSQKSSDSLSQNSSLTKPSKQPLSTNTQNKTVVKSSVLFEENQASNSEELIKEKKKVGLKRLLINIITIGVLSLVCGTLFGNYIITVLYMNIDYNKYDENSLKVNDSDIEYWKTLNITSLDAVQAFCIMEYNLRQIDSFSIVQDGIVKNSFKNQDFHAYFYKHNNEIYCDNLSFGIVNTGMCYFYKNDKITSFKGVPVRNGNTNWKTKQEYTYEEFKTVKGSGPEYFFYYLVSYQTVKSFKTLSNINGKYTYYLELNLDSSLINYVKQMYFISGISSPVFNDVHFQFTIDSNFNFISGEFHEIYVISYGILVTCESSSTVTIDYDTPPILKNMPEVS